MPIKSNHSRKFIDLTGKKFGKLTAVEVFGKTERGQYTWKCKCDCGNTVTVRGDHLRNGRTKSCKCVYKLPEGEARFRSLYKDYIDGALRRGLSFELSEIDFRVLTKGNCFYCGKEPSQKKLSRTKGYNGDYVYNGIDRLDNSVGYVNGNCVSCCGICNGAKSNLSYEDFIEWLDAITKFRNSKNLFGQGWEIATGVELVNGDGSLSPIGKVYASK